MEAMAELAARVAARLKERRETIAVSESSTGGLISASLLAVPGASAYFLGGAVVYTRRARVTLLGITDEGMAGMRSASEPYAALCAATVRERHRSTWGLAETGATGPKEQGKVMQKLMPELKGQADGGMVSRVVSELLKPKA